MENLEVDDELLDRLAEEMEEAHLYYLQNQMYQVNTEELREKLKGQIDDTEEIFADMTRMGFYQQEVEISPHLHATFRTITSKAQDQALEYARENASTNQEHARMLSRRRLAYALVSQNDKEIAEPINKPLFELSMGDDADPIDMLSASADKAMEVLGMMPENLVSRLSQAFGVWEKLVTSRIQEADASETVKN